VTGREKYRVLSTDGKFMGEKRVWCPFEIYPRNSPVMLRNMSSIVSEVAQR